VIISEWCKGEAQNETPRCRYIL